ncbi:related to inosine-uridine preferring nucleoside hydrolase [Cephalotrichum gorgonifer]|uniref:Related to inosine-uridine preferring nucleoside hydrolase n=1 Tax=Cephalotrichum gorgonifer TaxID=2041049 RepID=A0AAE8SQW6_9PEZI|nr:related to inosine-uridine preferring nucleoside hydrolase [Cephalotrichum gorgonifer]
MAPKNRIIIDTDPGVDDVLALLLALSASAEEIEVMMISVTYGNVTQQSCLRNVVSLFHVLEKEAAWRKSVGRAENFGTMRAFKPIVAVGPEHSLEDETLMADNFHGADGLHGVHAQHPHLSPAETWKQLFNNDEEATEEALAHASSFTPSKIPAHKEILRLLRENPEDTISIAVLGPLTNIALAASEDPEAFLRVKEVVVMGGAVDVPGNCTPKGEFNCYADPIAAARVFALTSPTPKSTMPPSSAVSLPPYPENLSRTLKLTLFPLDITERHLLNRPHFVESLKSVKEQGSPLAQWADHFLTKTFDNIERIVGPGIEPGLSLHDPMTIWYLLTQEDPAWKPVSEPEDIRIETTSQWSRGMHIVDRRGRKKALVPPSDQLLDARARSERPDVGEIPGDEAGWLSFWRGNRINRMVESPGDAVFAGYLMERIFG